MLVDIGNDVILSFLYIYIYIYIYMIVKLTVHNLFWGKIIHVLSFYARNMDNENVFQYWYILNFITVMQIELIISFTCKIMFSLTTEFAPYTMEIIRLCFKKLFFVYAKAHIFILWIKVSYILLFLFYATLILSKSALLKNWSLMFTILWLYIPAETKGFPLWYYLFLLASFSLFGKFSHKILIVFGHYFTKYYCHWNRFLWIKMATEGFPGGAVVENLPANAGDTGLSPGLGRSHMPWSD